MIAGEGHTQDGRLSLPRPGTDMVRKEIEPRLVPPHDHSGFLVGLFF